MNIKDAAEKALHLGKQLQAIVEVGKVLNEIGDLDNAKVEATRDANLAHANQLEAENTLKQVQQALQEAKDLLDKAKKDFKTLEAEAHQRMAMMHWNDALRSDG